MKKLLLFSFLALFLGFTSCDNDDDDKPADPQPSAKTVLITSKPWKLTGLTVNGADFFAIIPACQKDDLYKFALDGILSIEEGATSCNPTNANQGTWAFKENETVIALASSTFGLSGDFQIQELTETKAIIKRTDQSSGAVYVATFMP